MPKTGESNKQRRERTEDKLSYRGEQGTADHWSMGDTETARRANEDMIYNAAKRREKRKGIFARFQRDDDTAEIMDRAKDLNKYFNPNTRGENFAKGGKVKKYARGGGIEIKGKTKGRFV